MPFLRLLAALGLSAVLVAGATPRPLKVAVFKGLGADPECLSDAVEALKIDAAIHPQVRQCGACRDLNRMASGGLRKDSTAT